MRSAFALVSAVLVAFMSCAAGTALRENVPWPNPPRVADEDTTPVVIVTIDGVMWQDVFGPDGHALMPNTWAAVESSGVVVGAPGHGETFSHSGPNFVSLPGYTELFEGRARHRCANNFCNGATIPTLADEIRAQHNDPSSVAIITSWERIPWAATLSPNHMLVSAGSIEAQGNEQLFVNDLHLSHLYAAGRGVRAWPGHADYRPDSYTIPLALEVLTSKEPAFLFMGLGDTDEHAHHNDRPRYLQALRQADDAIGQLIARLRAMGERGRKTLVIVTADHGRAHDFMNHGAQWPESARSWLFAFGGPAKHGTYASAPVPRHLADIAPTIRAVVGLPPNSSSDGQVMTEVVQIATP